MNPIEVYTTTRHVISDSLVKRLDLSVNASDPTDGKVFSELVGPVQGVEITNELKQQSVKL